MSRGDDLEGELRLYLVAIRELTGVWVNKSAKVVGNRVTVEEVSTEADKTAQRTVPTWCTCCALTGVPAIGPHY